MKVTYWVCSQDFDSTAYNIRAKTKKQATLLRSQVHKSEKYSKPFKVTIEYDDAFDLLTRCLGEGGICELPPTNECGCYESNYNECCKTKYESGSYNPNEGE